MVSLWIEAVKAGKKIINRISHLLLPNKLLMKNEAHVWGGGGGRERRKGEWIHTHFAHNLLLLFPFSWMCHFVHKNDWNGDRRMTIRSTDTQKNYLWQNTRQKEAEKVKDCPCTLHTHTHTRSRTTIRLNDDVQFVRRRKDLRMPMLIMAHL